MKLPTTSQAAVIIEVPGRQTDGVVGRRRLERDDSKLDGSGYAKLDLVVTVGAGDDHLAIHHKSLA